MTKDNIKKLIPQVIKVLAFVLVFFVILQTLSVTVFSPERTSKISKKRADSYSYVTEAENTIDVVCLGSSDMWSGFVPTHLWEKYGFTSVVSSFSHQSVAQAQMMLEGITKTQNPKIALIDIDTLYDGRGVEEPIAPGKNKLKHFFSMADPEAFENRITDTFQIFTTHNIWKDYGKKIKRRPYAHGYLYNKTVVKNADKPYMIETDERDIPIETRANELRSFTNYCKKNDIQVLFVEMPSFYSWNYARYNAVQDLADELDVEFLDLNFMYDEIGISITDCYRDHGSHLNYAAACKVTEYLGAYVRDNYDIESRRDDSQIAEYWDEEVIKFKKHNKIKD